MRVALVHETAAPALGGAETSTLEMAAALVRVGHDVTLVTRGSEDEPPDETLDSGVGIHRIAVSTGTRVGRAIGFVRGADMYCLGEGFEIIHAVTPCFSANVYQPRGGTYPETIRRNLTLEPSALHRALKWIDRRLNQRQRFLTRLERDMLSEQPPPFVACVSEYVSRQVAADYGVPDERRVVVFNGVEPRVLPEDEKKAARERVRSAYQIRADSPLVLFVAHNPKLKGLRELIRAWPRVLSNCTTPQGGSGVSPDIGQQSSSAGETPAPPFALPQLLIVGRGKQRGLRLPGAVADTIHFAEPVIEIETLYATADMLAHPTWYDPCSRVVLEAVGSGIPAVTTRWNGAAEVMQDGVHGVVIDTPSNANALAAAITRCLSSDVQQACLAATRVFREQYSMAQHAVGLTTLYERVLGV